MQNIEVNIKQELKKPIDDNISIDTQKTSEREIYKNDLIDNDTKSENEDNKESRENKETKTNIIENSENKDNIDNKNNDKKNAPLNKENVEENLKIIMDAKRQLELNKKLNSQKESKESIKICCSLLILICSLFSILIIVFSINFFYLGVFIYYKKNFKECKAHLYKKLDDILPIYITLSIVDCLIIMNAMLLKLPFKCLRNCKCIGLVLSFPLLIINLILSIINIVMIHKNYKKTTSWENCGNFHGWALSWIILFYVSISLNILNQCCCSKGETDLDG